MERLLNFGMDFGKIDPHTPYQVVTTAEEMIPKNHKFLFDLIEKKKVAEKMEEDMKIYATGERPELKRVLMETLSSLHPYFGRSENVTAACLNRSLASELFGMNQGAKAAYIFQTLMFGNKDVISTDINEWMAIGYETTLSSIYDAIHNARMYITLVLDDSNPELRALSPQVRASMYSLVVIGADDMENNDTAFMELPPSLIMLPSSDTMRLAHAMIDFDEELAKQLFESAEELARGCDRLPDAWRKIASLDHGEPATDMQKVSYISSFQKLIGLEIYLMGRDNIRVKRCVTCGRQFPVLYTEQEYCDFQDEHGNSCYSKYQHREDKKKISFLYQKAYRARYNLTKSGKMTENEMKEWQEKTKAFKKIAIQNNMSPEEFETALKLQK